MSEEIKKTGNNGDRLNDEKQQEQSKPPEQAKDFKIAEIWIKDGNVALDAAPNFWMDKLRALGVMDYCKDIIKDYNPSDKQMKNRIQAVTQHKFRNFIRNIHKRKK